MLLSRCSHCSINAENRFREIFCKAYDTTPSGLEGVHPFMQM